MERKIPVDDWLFFALVILMFVVALLGIATICRADDSYYVLDGSDYSVDYLANPSNTCCQPDSYTITDGSLNPVYKVEGDKIMDYGTRTVVGVVKDDKIYNSSYILDYTYRNGQVKDMDGVVKQVVRKKK